MPKTMQTVFPKTQHQLCIVHQIGNSLKFVSYKDQKSVVNDLKVIYTATNAIESVNSQLRKVIKNKKIFPNDSLVFKIFYLAFQNMSKKWTMSIQNWGSAVSHLMTKWI